jgi:hypothetical protein
MQLKFLKFFILASPENDDDDDIQAEDAEEPATEEDATDALMESSEQPSSKKSTKTAGSQAQRITELPLARIKHIVKLDPDVKLVNSEW